jgi:Uma2 family endonuclease
MAIDSETIPMSAAPLDAAMELGCSAPGYSAPTCAPTQAFPEYWSFADLQSHLGNVPADRIRLTPPPGYATEHDLVRLQESKEARCELIDGVLVEKAMGAFESALAIALGFFLRAHLQKDRLGFVLGENGPVRTLVPQVRMPDVCFIRRDRFPDGKFPRVKIIPVAPDLAVEILSASNTRGEMARKLAEYFQAGTRLVWYIDPETRTAQAFADVDRCTNLTENDELDGGDVLPGFKLRLADLFAEAE